jgi:hypothetical protein
MNYPIASGFSVENRTIILPAIGEMEFSNVDAI